MSLIIPSGYDRGDGLDGRIGTPTDADQLRYSGPGNVAKVDDMPIEELSDSPTIERAENTTVSHRFRGPYSALVNESLYLYRGVYRRESDGMRSRILSAKLSHADADMGDFEVVEEMQLDVPYDTLDITPVELGVNILKHPRYFNALQAVENGAVDLTNNALNQQVIRTLQNYFDNPSPVLRNKIPKSINDSMGDPLGDSGTDHVSGTDLAKRAALEIISKFWRGEETPYIVGVQLTWTSYYFTPQPINLGGYTFAEVLGNSPVDPAFNDYQQIPPEFVYLQDAIGNPTTETIFDSIALWNPQSFSSTGGLSGDVSISWLRKADHPVFDRLLWKWERVWIGAPLGHWDEELYSGLDRPTDPDDYLAVNVDSIPTF